MPETQPNQIARVFALFALVGAFLLVAATIATSGGSSGGGGNAADESGPTKKGARAIENGFWKVGKGDTLVSISEETAIELDELIELNPNLDPQTLNTGQRISLRPGGGQAGGSPQGGGSAQGGGQADSGTGVGDGGPTGQESGADDGIPSN